MSFLLVDHIRSFTPGIGASGNVCVPEEVGEFPLSLVVEAVGQLAAYVAMEHADFARRPVAAIAGEVLANREIRPGQTLELEIEVHALRANAMRYGGVARIDGAVAVELRRCTGALLPMEDFDDPERVRAELQRLRSGGAPERTFPSRWEFSPTVVAGDVDREGRLTATLTAPVTAPLYGDHFPRRPVYPATLLLGAKIAIARDALERGLPTGAPPVRLRAVRDVKVRTFTPPGGRIDVIVGPWTQDEGGAAWRVPMEATSGGNRVSSAIAVFEPVRR